MGFRRARSRPSLRELRERTPRLDSLALLLSIASAACYLAVFSASFGPYVQSCRMLLPFHFLFSFECFIPHVRFLDLDHYPAALPHLSAITQGPSYSTRYRQSHIKASYASVSNDNFASTALDATFLPSLVSFLLPNHSHHLHVSTLTPIYPPTGQAPLHQRHNALPRPTKRQTSFDRALPRPLQTRRRHRHNSPPRWPTTHQTGPAVPIRHCRRTGQPNRRALSTARPVPLHVSNPPPARQHPVLLPLHRPATRRRDRLPQLHAV